MKTQLNFDAVERLITMYCDRKDIENLKLDALNMLSGVDFQCIYLNPEVINNHFEDEDGFLPDGYSRVIFKLIRISQEIAKYSPWSKDRVDDLYSHRGEKIK